MQNEIFSTGDSDVQLLTAVAALVREVQETAPDYASRPTPIASSFLWRLVKQDCEVHEVDVPAQLELNQPATWAGVIPPIAGKYRIGIAKGTDIFTKMFALRHEYAHVRLGDVSAPDGGFITLADRGYMTWNERAADLFALADLIPGAQIEILDRVAADMLADDIRTIIREYWGQQWPEERVGDRASLRLSLFRDCGV